MAERMKLEWDGRVLEEQEDGSISITLNREDMLECAIQIWADYVISKDKRDFNIYLDDELRKVREERLLREYGGKNEKDKTK